MVEDGPMGRVFQRVRQQGEVWLGWGGGRGRWRWLRLQERGLGQPDRGGQWRGPVERGGASLVSI